MLSQRLANKGMLYLKNIQVTKQNNLLPRLNNVIFGMSPSQSPCHPFVQFNHNLFPSFKIAYHFQQSGKIFTNHNSNNSKETYNSLQSIFKAFKVNTDILSKKDYIYACMLIWSYYRYDRIAQFLRHKATLQKMVDYLKVQFLKGLSLEDIYALINFLRLSYRFKLKNVNIETFSLQLVKQLYKKQKIILSLPLVQLMKLLGRLLGLNRYSSFDLISNIKKCISTTIQKNSHPMSVNEIGILMQSLNQQYFLNKQSLKWFQIALKHLQSKIDSIDSINIIKIVVCLLNKQIQLMVAPELVQTINRLYSKAQQMINNKQQWLFMVEGLLSIQLNNPIHKNLYISIYNALMAHTTPQYIPQSYFVYFSLVLEKLRFHEFSVQQKQKFVSRLRQYYNKCQIQKLHDFGINLIGYVQSNYLRSDINLLDDVMKQKRILIFWEYILEYSYAKVKFPIEVLLSKIQPKTLLFNRSNEFMTVAVAVSRQSKLYDDAALKAHRQTLVDSIRNEKWTIEHIQFFLKEDYRNNKLLQQFFQQFSQHFIHNLHLFCQSKPQYLKKYNQLLLCIFLSSNLPIFALKAIPLHQLDSFLIMYIKKCKDFRLINPSLLFALITTLSSKKELSSKQDMMLVNTTIKLIFAYYKTITSESANIRHLYITLICHIIRMYKSLPIMNRVQLIQIIQKLMRNHKNDIFYGSEQHKLLLNTVAKHREMMKQDFTHTIFNSIVSQHSQIGGKTSQKSFFGKSANK